MLSILNRAINLYTVRTYSKNLLKSIPIKYKGSSLYLHSPINHFSLQGTCLMRKIHNTPSRWDHVVIKTPNFAESISEGDIKWQKSLGDFVNVGDVIGEIETDKTSLAVVASCPGKIVEFIASNDSTVTPGTELVKIDSSAPPPDTSNSAQPSTPQPSTSQPTQLPTPQPKTVPTPDPLPSQPLTSSPPLEQPTSPPQTKETRVKLTRVRKRIGERLKAAQNTYAMLTTFNEVDMTNVIATRKKYVEIAQKTENVRLGFLSPFVVATARALSNMPVVNATIVGEDIVYRDYVDISIAVSSPKGLVVPVLRDVAGLNYLEVEKRIAELSAKARDGSLSVEEMDGGTFTISNGGVFGSLMSTPILNPPQSAILGLHAIKERPVAVDGKVEIRPMMYLALTYDHRLIDGRESVTFLKFIKEAVEDPVRMLVGL